MMKFFNKIDCRSIRDTVCYFLWLRWFSLREEFDKIEFQTFFTKLIANTSQISNVYVLNMTKIEAQMRKKILIAYITRENIFLFLYVCWTMIFLIGNSIPARYFQQVCSFIDGLGFEIE